jgi:hypothetical protein
MVVIALKATNPNHHFDPRMPAIIGRMIATPSIPPQKKSPCRPKREFVHLGARIPNQNSTKNVPPNKPHAVFTWRLVIALPSWMVVGAWVNPGYS